MGCCQDTTTVTLTTATVELDTRERDGHDQRRLLR